MDATKMPEPTAPSLANDYPGKAYGVWWHRLVEELDWKADPASWGAPFDKAIPCSPDPDRGVIEWLLFLEAAKLRGEWHPETAICHSEMPFLWRLSDSECVEGIIDLAIFDWATGSWWIVDWKTNRIEASQAGWLKEIYEPQLSAYRAALRGITNAPVRAAIYSTPTGQWMDYDNAVLDARWRELAGSPEALEEALCL
jgi:ATP-dependent exoDNAse (exonuclease V) beta subunit